MGRALRRPLLLTAAVLALATAARAAAPAPADASREDDSAGSFELGLKGSLSREADERDFEWGPTAALELVSGRLGPSRLKYSVEASYDDDLTRFDQEGFQHAARVRATELRYAKVYLLSLGGLELKKAAGVTPYLSTGVQYVDSRTTGDAAVDDDFYWSPTWGAGAELQLTRRLTLALDYDRNTEGGRRRVSRLTAELKVAVFGAPD